MSKDLRSSGLDLHQQAWMLDMLACTCHLQSVRCHFQPGQAVEVAQAPRLTTAPMQAAALGQAIWLTRHNALHQQACVPYRRSQLQCYCSAPQKAVAQQQRRSTFSTEHWQQHAPGLLKRLNLAVTTTPQQLFQQWERRRAQQLDESQTQQLQQQLQEALDLQSCRLLMTAAAATCSNQQQYNQLHGLVHASTALFPDFELKDFQQLLQLCAQSRYIPDKEWLAAIMYADTGGFERLYKKEAPQDVVSLFSALSSMLGSPKQLFMDTQLHVQQQQAAGSPAAGSTNADPAAEVAALQHALQLSATNLNEIYQDTLLAGELSAVGGYWLLRRLLPHLQNNTTAVMQGLTALPGLNYQVLDAEDADLLLRHITEQLPNLNCHQLAAAITSCLPCLGEIAPTKGDDLAVLFQFAGAAAIADDGFTQAQAGQVLLVLAQLPGYAPDAQVAQALLDRSLQPPLDFNAAQLYQLLTAAAELEAVPRPEHMEHLQQVLNSTQS